MKILVVIVVFSAVFLYLAKHIERICLYFPTSEIEALPSDIGLSYEDVLLRARDGTRLKGWYIAGESSKPTVLLCHGNGGNMSHRLHKLKLFNRLGLNVLIFDYRGYGESEGLPDEQGFYRDSKAAYDYLTNQRQLDGQDIIIYGESLGGAVAVHLASKVNVLALITEDTFTKLSQIAKITYPILPGFLIRSQYDTLKHIKKISCPKLIIHSIDDEIVPFEMAEEIYRQALEPKIMLKLRGGHNTAYQESEAAYISGLENFIASLGSRETL